MPSWKKLARYSWRKPPPRGNLSAHPRNAAMLDACAETIVAVLRLTGALT